MMTVNVAAALLEIEGTAVTMVKGICALTVIANAMLEEEGRTAEGQAQDYLIRKLMDDVTAIQRLCESVRKQPDPAAGAS